MPHIVDNATHLIAAQFVDTLTTESVWETILTLWVIVYTGLPNTLVFDDGSQFGDTFVEICEINNLEYQKHNITVLLRLEKDIMSL